MSARIRRPTLRRRRRRVDRVGREIEKRPTEGFRCRWLNTIGGSQEEDGLGAEDALG
jgi:hypothetical protein